MADESFKSDKMSIGDILSLPTRYVVPPHQRNFAWDKERIEAFWDDVKSTMENKETSYFLGSMIFQKTEDKHTLEIIDGQQSGVNPLFVHTQLSLEII